MNRHVRILSTAVLCLIHLLSPPASAEDWPTYRHDNRRSGITSESLSFPVQRAWEYQASQAPSTAWAGPAKWDSYANIRKLKSMRNFDPVFYVTTMGDRVFFGSSIDDAVHCLDMEAGLEQWVFFAEGPVRLPPSIAGDKLYFGSDDGRAYCITADVGELVWDRHVAPRTDRIPINGKLSSLYPCRTGVLVQDAKAYFAASLLPWQKTYVCAVDAESGASDGDGLYQTEYDHLTAQGPMLASPTKLYLSQGRQTPVVFERDSGKLLKSLGNSGFGGVFGLLTEDAMFIHGYGQNHRAEGELRFFDHEENDRLVTFPKATSIVVRQGIVYLYADGQLQAFDRDKFMDLQGQIDTLGQRQEQLKKQQKKLGDDAAAERERLDREITSIGQQVPNLQKQLPSCFLWRVASDCPLELILAGQTLFAGGEDKVAAYETATGREIWTDSVEGRAYGLGVAQGHLFVSTDLGRIVCFRSVAAAP